MAVNSVSSSNNSVTYTSETTKNNSDSMVDTQTFLNLLVTQLKYQDPLSPQDNTAFVTQLAQMSSLSQMQSINATMKNSQAYDMIGKVIYAEVLDKETGETNAYAGIVDSVIIKDGIPYVVVGNAAINVNDILQVMDPPAEDDTPDDNSSDNSNNSSDSGTSDTSSTTV